MPDIEKVQSGLQILRTWCAVDPHYGRGLSVDECNKAVTWLDNALDMLKALEPRVLAIDSPDAEWNDKVIWLEIKGKTVTPCMFCKCSDQMMFGRYERLMYFDVIGSALSGGYMLKNYGVKWRCWSQVPTNEQMEATAWKT